MLLPEAFCQICLQYLNAIVDKVCKEKMELIINIREVLDRLFNCTEAFFVVAFTGIRNQRECRGLENEQGRVFRRNRNSGEMNFRPLCRSQRGNCRSLFYGRRRLCG